MHSRGHIRDSNIEGDTTAIALHTDITHPWSLRLTHRGNCIATISRNEALLSLLLAGLGVRFVLDEAELLIEADNALCLLQLPFRVQ